MIRALAALGVLTGCGRIGFDGRDGAGGDAAQTGQRWVRVYPSMTGANGRVSAAVPDGAGGAAAVVPFQGTIQVDDAAITAQGTGVNSLVTTIRPDSTTGWVHALHSGFHCDMRAVDVVPGGVLAGGLTSGPLDGSGDPCDLGAQAPQDPLVIAYAGDGTFGGTTTWDATGANAQLWQVRVAPDDTRAILGVYGGTLTINGVALPPAGGGGDAAFVARVGGGAVPPWQYGFTSATDVYPRVLDLDPTTGDVCIAGWFDSTTTIVGTVVTTVGGNDVWVARLGPDGAAKFVRSLGSAAADDVGGVIAGSDGGCALAVRYSADLPLGGATAALINQGGSDVAVIRLAPDGGVVGAAPIASPGNEVPEGLVLAAGVVFVAIGFDAPLAIGATPLTPQGLDAALIQLTGDAADTVAEVITGAGDVDLFGTAARGNDVVMYGAYTGELRIGAFTDTRADQSAFVMAADLR